MRFATRFPQPAATNLGFVFIDDASIAAVGRGMLGARYGLYWPRHVYGRLVRELSTQGAEAAALDMLFTGLRPDHFPIQVRDSPDGGLERFLNRLHPDSQTVRLGSNLMVESDDFFAWQLHQAGNVILAAEKATLIPDLFRTNAASLGDVSAEKDNDGVLRRAKAFTTYRRWHPLFLKAADDYGLDLGAARIGTNAIILSQPDGNTVKVPLGADGCFALADFVGDKLPAGWPSRARPFDDERVWQMGIVLAASALGFDLSAAQVDIPGGKITFRAANGVERVLPVDSEGYFYVNWELTPTDPRLTQESIGSLLEQDLARTAGQTQTLTNRWRGRLAVVGSSATGNDLTDRGATPIEEGYVARERTLEHGELAHHRAVHPTGAAVGGLGAHRAAGRAGRVVDLEVARGLGAGAGPAAGRGLRRRACLCFTCSIASGCRWSCRSAACLLMTHVSLVTWRVVFEQRRAAPREVGLLQGGLPEDRA